MRNIAIIVSNGIESKISKNTLYQVYKASSLEDMNRTIKESFKEGYTSILAFVEDQKQEAMLLKDQTIHTFVTKCNGITAGFFVKQAEMLIQAKLSIEDICMSLNQSIQNYSI